MACVPGVTSDVADVCDGLLTNATAGRAVCMLPDPLTGATVTQQLPDLSQAITQYGVPLVLVMVLSTFLAVYLVTTFTAVRCAKGRKVLRNLDIRRDPARVFGDPGKPVLAPATTVGGCSLVLILAVAAVRITLSYNTGSSVDACEVVRIPTPITLGAEFVAQASLAANLAGGAETALDDVTMAYMSYYWEFVAVPRNTFASPAFAADTGSMDSTAEIAYGLVCHDLVGADSPILPHLPEALRDDFVASASCVTEANIVNPGFSRLTVGYQPLAPMSLTVFSDPLSGVPQYALSNDCMDMAALRKQVPSFQAFGGCGAELTFKQVVPDTADRNIFQQVIDLTTAQMVADEAHSSPSKMSREARAYLGKSIPYCNSMFFTRYDEGPVPAQRRANAAARIPGLFSRFEVERFMVKHSRVALAPSLSCAGSTRLPALRDQEPEKMMSTVVEASWRAFLPDTPDRLKNASALVWPACRYATGKARTTAAGELVGAAEAPDHDRYAVPEMAGTAEGVHRFYFLMPTGDLSVAQGSFDVNVKCPTLDGVLLAALSGIGGLLVFHPFLRTALSQLRRRAAFPRTAMELQEGPHPGDDATAGGGGGGGSGGGAGGGGGKVGAREMLASARASIKERKAPACMQRARDGKCHLHPTLRSMLAISALLALLWYGNVVVFNLGVKGMASSKLAPNTAVFGVAVLTFCFCCSCFAWVVDGAVAMRVLCVPLCCRIVRGNGATTAGRAGVGVAVVVFISFVAAAGTAYTNGTDIALLANGFWFYNFWMSVVLAICVLLCCSCVMRPCVCVTRRFKLSAEEIERRRKERAERRRDASSDSDELSQAEGDGGGVGGEPLAAGDAKQSAVRVRGSAASAASRRGPRPSAAGAAGARAGNEEDGVAPHLSERVRQAADGKPRSTVDPRGRTTPRRTPCSFAECCLRTKVVCCRGAPIDTCWKGVGYDETPLYTYNPRASAAGDVEMGATSLSPTRRPSAGE
mmetsp:Transcript_3849/g.14312  ORF Transcript_3849/g.14312 Transcript_3849/m.14312 type:complete len:984 (-) Transcript_3849:33-2984(-)